MRAAVCRGGAITVEDVPEPVPTAGQVLIAPVATGICGSDLHVREMLTEFASHSPDATFPMVLGHEVAGEIVAIGPDSVTDLTVGDLVTAIPFTPGAVGAENIGLSPTYGGGLAELTRFDAARSFRVPDGVDARVAALTEPIAVAVHAFARAATQGPIAVIGVGPIGLAIVAVAVIEGRGPIVAVDHSPTRRDMARRLGADLVRAPGPTLLDLLGEVGYRPSPVSPLLEGDPSTATVFECVGRPDVVQSLLAGAPPHSRLVLAGACGQPVEMQPLQLTLSEVTVDTSFAYRPGEFRRALELVSNRPDVFSPLVTSDRPLEATEAAFDDLASDPEELKILIHPNA